MNYHQQARQALPELVRLLAAYQAAITELKRPIAAKHASRAELSAMAREALLSGQSLDPTIGEQLMAADRASAEFAAQRTLVRDLSVNFKHEAEEYERTHSTEMIEALKPHLDRILSEAHEAVAGLKGARTAEAAIEGGADVLAAWGTLTGVASDYASLRQAHWLILRTGWSHYSGGIELQNPVHGLHTAIRGAEELWDKSTEKLPPWPCDELRPAHAPNADRTFLMWAVNHTDYLWLPTVPEVIAEKERYTEAVLVEPAKLPTEQVQRDARMRALQASMGGQGFARG